MRSMGAIALALAMTACGVDTFVGDAGDDAGEDHKLGVSPDASEDALSDAHPDAPQLDAGADVWTECVFSTDDSGVAGSGATCGANGVVWFWLDQWGYRDSCAQIPCPVGATCYYPSSSGGEYVGKCIPVN